MKQSTLSSILVVVCGSLFVGALLVRSAFVREQMGAIGEVRFGSRHDDQVERVQADLSQTPARCILTVQAFEAAILDDRLVLFCDCDWHVGVVIFRMTFAKLARQVEGSKSYEVAYLKVDKKGAPDLYRRLQQFWAEHSVSTGSIRTTGGAGRLVWIRDGQLAATGWWSDFQDIDVLHEHSESVLLQSFSKE